jgi:hypothetical protein
MTRLIVLILLAVLLAGMAFVVFTLLAGDNTLPGERDDRPAPERTSPVSTPANANASAPATGTGPKSPGADRNTRPGHGAEPLPPPAPSPRLVLKVGWIGTRPADDWPKRPERDLPPSPFPPLPVKPPLERPIQVRGVRPARLDVWAGPPWGLRKFLPTEGEPVTFLLHDPYAGRGPRVLRFRLTGAEKPFVDRFLEEGEGPAAVFIGQPGEITGRLTDLNDRPLPGVVEADGIKAQADFNGDFTLRGVRAGLAVVCAMAPVPGYVSERSLLQSPGGPYPIRLGPGANLVLRLEGLPVDAPVNPPVWACAVPARGATLPDTFPAESVYHRETRTGEIRFQNLPRGSGGVVVIWHPRYATEFVRIASLQSHTRSVVLRPRAVVKCVCRDASTRGPIAVEVELTTSADETTLFDLAVARRLVPAPRDPWRQPVPYLGQKLVDPEGEPVPGMSLTHGKGHAPPTVVLDGEEFPAGTYRFHVDPALEQLSIRAAAAGYLPQIRKVELREAAEKEVVFDLKPALQRRRAEVVLTLPEAPPGGWASLRVEGTGSRTARVDARRGKVYLTNLPTGTYWFKLEGAGEVKPLQLAIPADARLELHFPD